MAAILVSDEADATVLAIAKWLANNASAKAKMDFLAAVTDKIKLLASSPELGRKSDEIPGLRGIVVDQHHKMYYTYSGDTVTIPGVVDMRRQPGGAR